MNKLFRLLPLLAALPVASVAAEKPTALQPKATLPAKQCAVHHQVLKSDWVKIKYGMIYIPKDYREALQKEFPNSNKTVGGGCVIRVATNAKTGRIVRSPQFAKVDYCSKCRSAEYLWHKAHPRDGQPERPKPVANPEEETYSINPKTGQREYPAPVWLN